MSALLPKKDFPILVTRVNGQPLVYLDSAATTQKPRQVLSAMDDFYKTNNANVHRGVHELSVRATRAYDQARATVQRFIGAGSADEIIFTRNATEAINLVAAGVGDSFLAPGQEIIVTELEHHSNLVPWQVVAQKTGARLKVWKLRNGKLDLQDLRGLLSSKTKIVALAHVSNVLGCVIPVEQVVQLAHEVGALVVVDGAQAVGHIPVDVAKLDCDFYVFSGHKVYGPTGIGVLFGKRKLLERLPPYQTGGDMVQHVSFETTTYAPLPQKFEAGTPNVAGAVGLAAALDYIGGYGIERIARHERELADRAQRELAKLPGVTLINPSTHDNPGLGIVTFVIQGVHPHDIGTLLDRQGVAIRTGLLCAEPLVRSLEYEAVCRASFAGHNDQNDVEALVSAVQKVLLKFSRKKLVSV